jgi:hypothetical protein
LKIDLGSIGIILLVGILFYLSVREPIPAAIIGVGITPAPRKASGKPGITAAKRKPTPTSRAKSSGGGVGGQGKVGGTAQKKVIQKEGGSQKAAENRAAKKRAAVPTLTPAQQAVIIKKRQAQHKAVLRRRMNLRIKLAALKLQAALKQRQGGYRPISMGGYAGALGTSPTGLEHGGTGGAIGGMSGLVASMEQGVNQFLGRTSSVKSQTIEQRYDTEVAKCSGNQTCTTDKLRKLDKEVDQAVNATQAKALADIGGGKPAEPGLQAFDETQKMA